MEMGGLEVTFKFSVRVMAEVRWTRSLQKKVKELRC